jgi:hypothetical protein
MIIRRSDPMLPLESRTRAVTTVSSNGKAWSLPMAVQYCTPLPTARNDA